jgi:hypothetical protein
MAAGSPREMFITANQFRHGEDGGRVASPVFGMT